MIGRAAPAAAFTGRDDRARRPGRGFFNDLYAKAPTCWQRAGHGARAALATDGPTFAHGMTKTMLSREWSMTIDRAGHRSRGAGQAICMQTEDFRPRVQAFAAISKARVRSGGLGSCERTHHAHSSRLMENHHSPPLQTATLNACRLLRKRIDKLRTFSFCNRARFHHAPGPCPPSTAHLAPALFWRRPPHAGRGPGAWAAAQESMKPTTAPLAATGCGAWARAAGCATACRQRTVARCPHWTRALVLLRETLVPPLAAGGLCVCDAGAGQRCDHAGGQPPQQAHYLHGCGAWRADCGVCAPARRAGSMLAYKP